MTVRRLWEKCFLCGGMRAGGNDPGVFACNECLTRVVMQHDRSQRLVGAQLNRHHEDRAIHWALMRGEV